MNPKNKRTMKKVVYLLAGFAALTFTGVQAQDDGGQGGDPAEFAKKMISNQADALAKDLDLDDSKAADFKTLFTEYKEKEFALKSNDNGAKGKGKKGGKKEAKRPKMSDSQADSLMTARFELQENELKLQKEYYGKLKQQFGAAVAFRVLSPQQQRPQMNGGPNRQGRGGMPGGGPDNQGFPGGSF